MGSLVQALDELDDLVAMLRHWLLPYSSLISTIADHGDRVHEGSLTSSFRNAGT